ncbi:AraC family transcriptional regulator [Pararhodobacter sp.]|uniref:AraC family transcriptional regulator n=1 Tax=Pararhodobacter sp. TaxID=2127056 RepID=UPI002AFEA9E4|nr:AraC family transcriptional regulator [Pararhodobacter sp.]
MDENYHNRIQRVHAAIHTNPAADHSLDDLADTAALSRFHFHRVFTAMSGETVAEAVRRIRLKRAAMALRRGNASVAEVGRAHGYPNPGSFSRAFRAAFGQTPSQFRRDPVDLALPLYLAFKPGDPKMYPVTISEQPSRSVHGLRHQGPYPQIGQAFERVSAVIGKAGLWPQVRGMVAIYLDDPAIVPPAKLRGMAAVTFADGVTAPEGLLSQELAAGRYAVMRVTGPYSGLSKAYTWLFGTWLVQSGETPRDEPHYELYVNSPTQAAPEDLITDIYLPLSAAGM